MSKVAAQKKRWMKYYYELGEGITAVELSLKYGVSAGTIRGWISSEGWKGVTCDLCSKKYEKKNGYKIVDNSEYALNFCSADCMFRWQEEEDRGF